MASSSAISPPEGSSDENPLVLRGVSENHFRNFLGLIYPFCVVASPSTDEQWLGILHLATEWDFTNVRLFHHSSRCFYLVNALNLSYIFILLLFRSTQAL
ncbi:hypothetical protein BJ165DRAFT_997358 [Panaeolus papilionaceus]|nr:hypothetical protein BJ165DRAFT_997358 [Panaeolus papilionaceus]